AGKIKVLCGIEQDFYSEQPTEPYAYTICSVHYLKLADEYVPLDNGKDVLISAAKRYFGGDMYALVEEYFRTAGEIAEKKADIVGHFDYIRYHNDSGALFDESHPRYRNAWRAAAEKLLQSGKIFEYNVGGITRKGKTEAYPSGEICGYISSRGGTLLYSGDCHAASQLQKFPPFFSQS
ncbi:MAG: PHP domain-containing protein, partial [Clostridia bacterium]|nr:PHP domain-containing protein [Clostridia bacterium]